MPAAIALDHESLEPEEEPLAEPIAAPPEGAPHKYLIAFAVVLAALMQVIDSSIVNVALPDMMGNLGASLDEIAWVSTGYILASVIIIPLTGWLGEFFGRKRYFVGSIVIFTVASFLCGASHSLAALVFWRIVQGLGGGALMTVSQAVLFESFPRREAGTAMALFGLGVMVGPTIGPTLGGYIVDNFAWPWIFYINVPLGIFAAFMVWTYVKDSEHQERASTVDGTGIVLLALCVGSLQWMLERGERYDWFDSRFVTVLGVTTVTSLVLLIWRELTIDEPVINFRVLLNRQLAGGVAIGAFLGFALYGSVFVLPVFLQSLHGWTANQTGMVILPGAIASAVTMAVVGRNASRLDARVTVPIGASLFLYSMWRLSLLSFDAGAHDLFWPLISRGVGLGLIFVPLTGATMAELEPSQLAQGTGMFNLTRQLGGSLGIAISATLLSRFTAQSRALLAEHIVVGDPATLARLDGIAGALVGKGMNALSAKQQALMILDRQLQGQASVLAFSKLYLLSGIALMAALPLLLLFRSGKSRGLGPGAAH
jgi:DHA2 family multidrug resistance protein